MKNSSNTDLPLGFALGVSTSIVIAVIADVPEHPSFLIPASLTHLTAVPVVQQSLTTASNSTLVGYIAKSAVGPYITIGPEITREEQAFLWAIAQVESGGELYAISKDQMHWGKYQLSFAIIQKWEMEPYANGPLTESEQTACALWHLRCLETTAASFNVRTLAVLWRGKDEGDYAQRVENLYQLHLKQNQP